MDLRSLATSLDGCTISGFINRNSPYVIAIISFLTSFIIFVLVFSVRGIIRYRRFLKDYAAKYTENGDHFTPLHCPMLRPRAHLFSHILQAKGDKIFKNRLNWQAKFGTIFAVRASLQYFCFSRGLPRIDTVIISDPKAMKSVLGDYRTFRKHATGKAALGMDNAMTRANLDTWDRQRRAVQREFRHDSLESFAPVLLRISNEFVADVRREMQMAKAEGRYDETQGYPANLLELFRRVALDVMITCTLGSEGASFPQRALFGIDFSAYWKVHRRLEVLTESQREERVRNHTIVLRGIVEELLARRKRERNEGAYVGEPCFLDHMIKHQYESSANGTISEALTDKEIVDNVFSFLVAGFETGAHVMTMCGYHLSQNPDVLAKAHKEIDAAFTELGGDPAKLQDQGLEYMAKVVKESLRLHCPVMQCARFVAPPGPCSFETSQGKISCSGRTNLFCDMLAAQRDPKTWGENSEQFVPERWDKASVAMHQAYMPFGAGPRVCVGQMFAMMELKVVFATFLRNFHFETADPHFQPDFQQAPTLVLKNGMPVLLKDREIA